MDKLLIVLKWLSLTAWVITTIQVGCNAQPHQQNLCVKYQMTQNISEIRLPTNRPVNAWRPLGAVGLTSAVYYGTVNSLAIQ